jgi:uncharacterized SAM-binding protein YcdF (DUF218 family)
MFLFLSKLLPLLVYPLGLAVALLGITIGLAWRRRPRWAIATATTALLILLLSSNAWVATRLTQSLEWRHLPPNPVPTADAIVVLGGSTRSAIYPRPWVDLMESGDRVLHGIRLYQAGKAPKLIFSGGRIVWRGGGRRKPQTWRKLPWRLGCRDRPFCRSRIPSTPIKMPSTLRP